MEGNASEQKKQTAKDKEEKARDQKKRKAKDKEEKASDQKKHKAKDTEEKASDQKEQKAHDPDENMSGDDVEIEDAAQGPLPGGTVLQVGDLKDYPGLKRLTLSENFQRDKVEKWIPFEWKTPRVKQQ